MVKSYREDLSGPQNLYLAVCNELPPRDLNQTFLPNLLCLLKETLAPREDQFVRGYYGIGQEKLGSLENVGKELFGVAHAMASKIKASAILKLREPNNLIQLVSLFSPKVELYARIRQLTRQNDELTAANYAIYMEMQEAQGRLRVAEDRLEKVLGYGHEPLSMPLEELFSERVLNAFDRCREKVVADLVVLTERQVRRTPGIGQKSLEEIKEKLGELGLELRKEDR